MRSHPFIFTGNGASSRGTRRTDNARGQLETSRRLCWTEDVAAQSERRASLLAFPSQSCVGAANRLQAFMERGNEGGIAAYYNYSADGERNLKLTSPRLNIQQNATLFNNPPLVYPMLYASPLITLTAKGYTKHYFEEGRRVCSKLGGGFRRRVPVVAIDKRVPELAYDYDEQFHHQHDGVEETFGNCVGAWPELIDKYDLHMMLLDYKGDEKPFFYHSDHLGSAAYLTSGGHVTQTLNYLPYGEDWVDIQNNLDPNLGQYTFNGKEKDYESGFHYYGARYYWSEMLTGWLSVDPMMDKYPSISPYAYCTWNPVKLVDPDGNEPWYKLISGYNKDNTPKAPTAARRHPVTGNVRPHHGMDMAFKKGGRINAAASGKVIFSGFKNGYGKTVVIDHGGGFYSLYAHMNTINVNAGDMVQNGAQLGEVGNTGIGTGPHLHVEYIKTDNTINIFGGNKNACRFNPMDINDLQDIIDGKESKNVQFLDGHIDRIGGLDNIRPPKTYLNPMPEPTISDRLQENRVPIVKTVGDILKIVGL